MGLGPGWTLGGATCGREDVVWGCVNASAGVDFYGHRRPSAGCENESAPVLAAVLENVNLNPLPSRNFWEGSSQG